MLLLAGVHVHVRVTSRAALVRRTTMVAGQTLGRAIPSGSLRQEEEVHIMPSMESNCCPTASVAGGAGRAVPREVTAREHLAALQ